MAISNPGGNLNSVAAPQKQTLSSNYIDFTSDATKGWAQQYLPDLLEKEAEVFGNRTISGFLSQVGAEESMTSDQVIWSEQGRLHLHYKAVCSSNNIDMSAATDVDGNGATEGFVAANHGLRKNDLIIISSATVTKKAIISNVSGTTVTPLCFDGSAIGTTFGTDPINVLVYGSEFVKGVAGQTTANEPVFKTLTNKPIILKDYYEISGSDVSQIGWVEVSGEEGQNGYYWYVKAESDTRARFADHLEMAMLESEKGAATNTIDTGFGGTDGDAVGTEGLFAAIEDRGNIATGITGINAATDLFEFDSILAEFDRQGAIEENMMFVNRDVSLAMDDMLASMNSYGAGGTSYGVFNNSEDMALTPFVVLLFLQVYLQFTISN